MDRGVAIFFDDPDFDQIEWRLYAQLVSSDLVGALPRSAWSSGRSSPSRRRARVRPTSSTRRSGGSSRRTCPLWQNRRGPVEVKLTGQLTPGFRRFADGLRFDAGFVAGVFAVGRFAVRLAVPLGAAARPPGPVGAAGARAAANCSRNCRMRLAAPLRARTCCSADPAGAGTTQGRPRADSRSARRRHRLERGGGGALCGEIAGCNRLSVPPATRRRLGYIGFERRWCL